MEADPEITKLEAKVTKAKERVENAKLKKHWPKEHRITRLLRKAGYGELADKVMEDVAKRNKARGIETS